jgi:hypothetical protein
MSTNNADTGNTPTGEVTNADNGDSQIEVRNNERRANTGRSNDSNGARNRDNSKKSCTNTSDKMWQGDKPEVGGVLSLRTEWLDKKVSFDVMMEKMTDYVLREFKNGTDVVPVVRDQVDPREDFEENHLPKELTKRQQDSAVHVAIQQQRIKLYVTREAELESNMNKIYGIVKGQCSHSLRTVLKQEDDYEQKDKEHNILWLLEHLKSITSGLDSKSNKRCNLFDAILVFITMRQGENENDSNLFGWRGESSESATRIMVQGGDGYCKGGCNRRGKFPIHCCKRKEGEDSID